MKNTNGTVELSVDHLLTIYIKSMLRRKKKSNKKLILECWVIRMLVSQCLISVFFRKRFKSDCIPLCTLIGIELFKIDTCRFYSSKHFLKILNIRTGSSVGLIFIKFIFDYYFDFLQLCLKRAFMRGAINLFTTLVLFTNGHIQLVLEPLYLRHGDHEKIGHDLRRRCVLFSHCLNPDILVCY